MTYICYVGIEVSANFQKALLGIEVTMLVLLSVVALSRSVTARHRSGTWPSTWTWFNPFDVKSPQHFINGVLLMVFIYWGWDTAVSVNEETADPNRPRAGRIISTFVLLGIYVLVILSAQSFAGVGTTGIGLGNPANVRRRALGPGPADLRLTRASARPWPPARADGAHLSGRIHPDHHPADRPDDPVHGRLQGHPQVLRAHPRAASHPVGLDCDHGRRLDRPLRGHELHLRRVRDRRLGSALGVMIAFYYGLTGFACAWYYRTDAPGQRPEPVDARDPAARRRPDPLRHARLQPLVLLEPATFYNELDGAFWPHWHMGGVFVIEMITILIGVVLMVTFSRARPAFFRGEVLNRDTPTMVPEPRLRRPPRGRAPPAPHRGRTLARLVPRARHAVARRWQAVG